MRTTVIPAQITTVEDKIAGNLNLTQIILLMIPIFWTTIVYLIFYPASKLALYKFPLVGVVVLICLVLALRIKGKVVFEWLFVLIRYNARPKYYLFNKNDSSLRVMDLPVFEKKPIKLFKKAPAKKEEKVKLIPSFAVPDLIRLENLLNNPDFSFSIKTGKKGDMHAAFHEIKK